MTPTNTSAELATPLQNKQINSLKTTNKHTESNVIEVNGLVKKETDLPIIRITKQIETLDKKIADYNFPDSMIYDQLEEGEKKKLIALLVDKESLETQLFKLRYKQMKGSSQ